MCDYIERLKTERSELVMKLNKLVEFMKTDKYRSLPRDAQGLMLTQCNLMSRYSRVLTMRMQMQEEDEKKAAE